MVLPGLEAALVLAIILYLVICFLIAGDGEREYRARLRREEKAREFLEKRKRQAVQPQSAAALMAATKRKDK